MIPPIFNFYCILQECPFHTMEAHNHIWTMYHAEPDLWLLLVVGRGLVGPHCLNSNLASFIKGLHNLSTLLYGLLSTQLQQVGHVRILCCIDGQQQSSSCAGQPYGMPDLATGGSSE